MFNAMLQYEEGGEITEHFQEREERQFQVVGFLEHWGDTQRNGAGIDASSEKEIIPMLSINFIWS